MKKNFFAKIIAKDPKSLQFISAFCEKAKTKSSEIKFLKDNKIFLFSMNRINKEKNGKELIKSVCRFEFIENVKSINIDQENPEEILELIAINPLKKDKDYSITLLFNKNRIITLTTEVIEATLEDQNNQMIKIFNCFTEKDKKKLELFLENRRSIDLKNVKKVNKIIEDIKRNK